MPVRGYSVRPDLKNKDAEITVGPRERLSIRTYLFSMYSISAPRTEGEEGKTCQLQWFKAVTLNNAGLGQPL